VSADGYPLPPTSRQAATMRADLIGLIEEHEGRLLAEMAAYAARHGLTVGQVARALTQALEHGYADKWCAWADSDQREVSR
jgi:hypothetical protein